MIARDTLAFIIQAGTNAERLALPAESIRPMTAFHETDTGDEYKWFGTWVLAPGCATGVSPSGGGGGGGGPVSIADGADVTQGGKANAAATWYDSMASIVSLVKLWIAVAVDAGSHVYGYNGSGQLVTDAWTLLGTTRTKTFTYTAGVLTAESDWA